MTLGGLTEEDLTSIKIFRCECHGCCATSFHRPAKVLLFYAGQVFTPQSSSPVAHGPLFFIPGASAYQVAAALVCGALFSLTFSSSARKAGGGAHCRHPRRPRRYALASGCAAAPGGVALACLWRRWPWLPGASMPASSGWTDWGPGPACPAILAPLVFALGALLWAACGHRLLYVWMLLPALAGSLPLPEALGLWNGGRARPILDSGDYGPGFLPPGGGLSRPRAASGCRGAPLLVAGKGKGV